MFEKAYADAMKRVKTQHNTLEHVNACLVEIELYLNRDTPNVDDALARVRMALAAIDTVNR